MDGFPRTLPQAEGLDRLLAKMDRRVDWVIKLDISERKAQQRLGNRLICVNCGTDFNLETNPPQVSGICDRCGAILKQRFDDQKKTIENRLRVYEKETEPVQTYYLNQKKLVRINGELSPEDVFNQIQNAVGEQFL